MRASSRALPGAASTVDLVPEQRARDVPDGGYGTAVAALAKVESLGHARAATVHAAVGAVLAWVGAQRLRDALDGDPERVADREIIRTAAEMEAIADRLSTIPAAQATDRQAAWAAIASHVDTLRRLLRHERAMLKARAPSA